MLKFLVSIDGTENSLPAVKHVIRLKWENVPVSVVLLYVHYEPTPYGAVGGIVTPEHIESLKAEMSNEVFAEAEALLQKAGIEYQREFRVAQDIAAEIARMAHQRGCDAIVMGTHRGRPVLRSLTGSTASRAIQLADVPVTVVSEKEEAAAA
jgi:nucleotide-binding universal stress UspA family protein